MKFILGRLLSSNMGNICKFLYLTPLSAQCQEIATINQYAHGQLMINSTKFMFSGTDPSSGDLRIYKITFGNSIADWTNRMICSSSPCYNDRSENLISNDQIKIYSFIAFGLGSSVSKSSRYIYFTTFKLSDGSVIGTRYITNVSCFEVNGSAQTGDFIILTTESVSVPFSLLLYNTVTSIFTILQYPGSPFGCCVENYSGRFVITGIKSNNNGLISKFTPESFLADSDFTPSSMTMNILTPGTDNIIQESEASISAETTQSVANQIYTNQSVTYNQVSFQSSDVYYQTSTQNISAIENTFNQTTPDLPCSASGSTSISYGIEKYNGVEVPSWIKINSTTGVLNITAEEVSEDKEFDFYISSNINGVSNSIQKLIKLTVLNCTIENCKNCTASSVYECETCKSGYNLHRGNCTTTSNTAAALSTTTQSILGAAAITTTISSMMNASSLASLWSMINQIQMFFLLILTGVFIPDDVLLAITGSKFTVNPSDYVPFEKVRLYGTTISKFDFGLSSSVLDSVGISSDSTVYNTCSFFTMICLIILLHFFETMIYYCTEKINVEGKCSWFRKKIKCLLSKKIFEFLTFTFYIRTVMEINQFMLISTIYEIYRFNTSNTLKIVPSFCNKIENNSIIKMVFNPIKRIIYFSDRLYTEDKLPPEFKLFLPITADRKTAETEVTPISGYVNFKVRVEIIN